MAIFKFGDYSRNEQREIIFEIIKQKYLHNPQLNNFGTNCAMFANLIKDFDAGLLLQSELTDKFKDFYNKNTKTIADEVLFYFYNVAEAIADKYPAKKLKYSKICDIIKDIIDIDALTKEVTPPEDKMGKSDATSGGFVLTGYNSYPKPKSYVEPPEPPSIHNFSNNPIPENTYKTMCDWVRWRIFDLFKVDARRLKTLKDLGGIYMAELIPDSNQVENFPQCTDEDGEKEDLDFENPGVYIINHENSITFGGGGDWQEPQTFSVKVQNGKFKAFDIQDDYDDGGGYDAEATLKVICKLFGLDIDNYDLKSTNQQDLARLYRDMVKNKDYKLNVIKDISTEDCVAAIVDYFAKQGSTQALTDPKNWKRKSKTGSVVFTRIFENKVTKDQVRVTSTKIKIQKIEVI